MLGISTMRMWELIFFGFFKNLIWKTSYFCKNWSDIHKETTGLFFLFEKQSQKHLDYMTDCLCGYNFYYINSERNYQTSTQFVGYISQSYILVIRIRKYRNYKKSNRGKTCQRWSLVCLMMILSGIFLYNFFLLAWCNLSLSSAYCFFVLVFFFKNL